MNLLFSKGQVVLKVRAEDGDKGNPRQITYAVLADSSPFAPFFYMDPQTGWNKTRTIVFLFNLTCIFV